MWGNCIVVCLCVVCLFFFFSCKLLPLIFSQGLSFSLDSRDKSPLSLDREISKYSAVHTCTYMNMCQMYKSVYMYVYSGVGRGKILGGGGKPSEHDGLGN